QAGYEPVGREEFINQLAGFERQNQIVTETSLYVHLIDQYLWGLLTADEVAETGNELIAAAARPFNLPPGEIGENNLTGFISAWEKLLLGCMNQKLSQ
ncbi:MAG: hypothetical protein ABFC57_13045, partial [Veillonellales bacterium]